MGWNAIARHDGSSGWTVGARNQSVTYAGMTPLAEVPGSNPSTGAYRHYLHDHLGSTRALYDGSKALLARVAYTPYGEQAPSTAGAEAAYTFTGKPWEPETGLYHFPYRYYAPDRARWISRDPLGMVDGPNWYQYVKCNPSNMIDADGRLSGLCMLLCGIVTRIGCTALCGCLCAGTGPFLPACMIKCMLVCTIGTLAFCAMLCMDPPSCTEENCLKE